MQIDNVGYFRTEINDLAGMEIVIAWSINNGETAPIPLEFEELVISVTDEDEVKIDTESMGKDHFLKVMELLYDEVEVK